MLFSGTSNSSYIFQFFWWVLLPQFFSYQESQLISILESNSPSKQEQNITTYLRTEVEATLTTY